MKLLDLADINPQSILETDWRKLYRSGFWQARMMAPDGLEASRGMEDISDFLRPNPDSLIMAELGASRIFLRRRRGERGVRR